MLDICTNKKHSDKKIYPLRLLNTCCSPDGHHNGGPQLQRVLRSKRQIQRLLCYLKRVFRCVGLRHRIHSIRHGLGHRPPYSYRQCKRTLPFQFPPFMRNALYTTGYYTAFKQKCQNLLLLLFVVSISICLFCYSILLGILFLMMRLTILYTIKAGIQIIE